MWPYLLQVVTLLCRLLSASALSLPTLLPAEAGLPVTGEVPEPNTIYKEVRSSEVETEDSEEPAFPDENVEAAETLVFRPYYIYWQNYCSQKRKKQAGRKLSQPSINHHILI
jgi:hypothetical protein